MEEMGRVTGIRVCSHTHNEPGHGSDQCDSCGANCVRAIKAWHLEHGLPIDHALQSVAVMQLSGGLKGMIHQVIVHKPGEKLFPSMVRMCCRHSVCSVLGLGLGFVLGLGLGLGVHILCVYIIHTNTSYRFRICHLVPGTVYTKNIGIRLAVTLEFCINTGSST